MSNRQTQQKRGPERGRRRASVGPVSPERRRLISTAGAGGAAVLTIGALGMAATGQPEAAPLVRPPGSREGNDFYARCLRCDRCRSVCHTGAIGVARWDDGLRAMRTPVMDFHHDGFCDFCGRCADVCPTGAIMPFDKEVVKIGIAEVTDSCIALRTAACTKCHETCPIDAISLDAQNRPIVDAAICNGCGKCEAVCPANIFQAYKGGKVRGIVVKAIDNKAE